ncbi:MAG: hypothetical protein Q7U04_01620 [Bacteriovorax sp.]|nr:hypothetical protein [Bacteriovorax sp.]
MPSRIDLNLQIVIDQFTPDILGVFWITNEELNSELLGFNEFNYLFDGLISQYLYGQNIDASDIHLERSNVFFTLNFNQKLFLAHFKVHNEMAGSLDEQIALIQENKNSDRKNILVFNLTEKNWGSDLEKRYPQFNFMNLELTKI